MKVDLGIMDKLTKVVIFVMFIAGALAVGVWYLPLIRKSEGFRKQLMAKEEQIRKVEESNRQLKAAIESLKYDPKATERLARERLAYAKPGETVIRFEERTAPGSR